MQIAPSILWILMLLLSLVALLLPEGHAVGADVALHARYGSTVVPAVRGAHGAPQQEDWFFSRSPLRIASIRPAIGIVQIRERDARDGAVTLPRVFADAGVVIGYVPGQLRAMDRLPDRDRPGQVIDPAPLAGWPDIDAESLRSMRLVDAADPGDMHSDPLLRRIARIGEARFAPRLVHAH